MKRTLFIALIAALLLPAVASAQLITSAQTITVKDKLLFEGRYEQSIELPMATNFDDAEDETNYIGINYIGGYRFSNLFYLGAGVGINFNYFYEESNWGYPYNGFESGTFGVSHNLVSIPLYLHARLYFTNTECQPFFAFSIGGHLTGSKKVDNSPDVSYNPSCFFINPVFGLNFRTDSNIDFYVSTGLMARNLLIEGEWHNYGQNVKLYRGFDFGLAWSLSFGITL